MTRRALGGFLVMALVLAVATPSSSSVIVLPRPAPQLRSDITAPNLVLARNASCESCHADVAAEWQASRHRGAFSGEAFRASLAREMEHSRPFCRSCHAPEAPPSATVEDVRHGIGVACITCHVPLGPVLAAETGSSAPAPHGLLRTAAFSGIDACASCHEFSFPDPRMGSMQRTVSEHLASGSSATCQACHMPETGEGERRHRSHTFAGGYDEDLVRGALDVSAARAADAIEITLSPRGVTHRRPDRRFSSAGSRSRFESAIGSKHGISHDTSRAPEWRRPTTIASHRTPRHRGVPARGR